MYSCERNCEKILIWNYSPHICILTASEVEPAKQFLFLESMFRIITGVIKIGSSENFTTKLYIYL